MKKLLLFCVALVFVVSVGCARPEKKEEAKVFYPEPPELPRIQFLASFTGSKDIEPERSPFDVFLTGKQSGKFLQKPYGVAMYDGKMYVCDTMQGIMVFDFQNKTFTPFKGSHGTGKIIQPINISIDKAGNKYVADPGRGQVLVYDKDDFYVKALGTPGVWRPVDAAAYEDRVFVADIKNAEIRVFDKETGELVMQFGQNGELKDHLSLPTNISFDPDGYLYVSDIGRFQIVKFDRDGHVRGTLGTLGSETGHFARPKGISIDQQGNVYAVDAAFDVVQMFDKDGHLLVFFGKPGTGPGDLNLPAKVSVNYDSVKYFTRYADPTFDIQNIVIVTSQMGDHMVNVYGFGKERGKKYPTNEELEEQVKAKFDKLKKEQEGKTKDQAVEGAGEDVKKAE
jgi:sugar lactone lactonase YvrE